MRRILLLEMKRVLKTKSTLVLFGLALAFSLGMAFMALYNERIMNNDYTVACTGMQAVRVGNALDAPYEGQVLPEALRKVNEAYREVYNRYNGEIPVEAYRQEIWPLRSTINLMGAVYRDPETGFTRSPVDISPDEAADFYAVRNAYVEEEVIQKRFADAPAAQAQLRRLNAAVETPFTFKSYRGWDTAGEYIHFLTFLVLILCTVAAAPVFSSEYQTGSDSILRCTRHGRGRLAAAKLLSALLLTLGLFALCMGAFMLTCMALFGSGGLGTSVQFLNAAAVVNLTLGGLNAITIASGALSFLAVISFTLLVSAHTRAPLSTLVISLAVLLLPTLMRVLPAAGVVEWIRYGLPSGGIGIGHSVYYDLYHTVQFLPLGPLSVWTPYVMLIGAAVWVAVSIPLAVRGYCRHQVE